MRMEIYVFGKTSCGKCDAAKKNLGKLGVKYKYVALDNPGNWRGIGAENAMAEIAFANMDIGHPPILVIDGTPYEYAAAMAALKAKTREAGRGRNERNKNSAR